MVVRSRYAALIFRLGALALILTGLGRLMGMFSGGPYWIALAFYTTQSNVLCAAWLVVLIAWTIRQIRHEGASGAAAPWPRLSAMVMMAITVTMLIYLVVLAPAAFRQEGSEYVPFTLTDDLVHIIAPCLMIADWFLFNPKGRLTWWTPPTWAIPPYLYLAWAFTWHAQGHDFGEGRAYPYPFMNVADLGIGGVIAQIALLTVSLVGFGYLYVVADKLLARSAVRRKGGTPAARKTWP